MTIKSEQESVSDKFHKHLDECPICRCNPFNLCPIGSFLIQAAAKEQYDSLDLALWERKDDR